MRLFTTLLLIGSFTLSSTGAAAQRPARASIIASIDSLVARELAAPAAGFQVAVVKGRDTLVMKGYGYANLELQSPVTPETIFRIGSVTKQFTSAAIMQLAEQRKIRVSDSLVKYMPNIPAHWRGVTIRHLLNHTSGIPSYTDVGPRVRTIMVLGTPRDSMITFLRSDSLLFAPGTGFYYNNSGYYILGMLVEKLSGKTYGAYVDENLASTLGLAQTRYCGSRPVIRNRASGYDRVGSELVNTGYIDMDIPYSAGSICSSARDLVKWGAALASGRVVTAASYNEMTSPVKLPSPRPMTYGYGLTVDTMGTYRVVQHGGNINGFAANLTHVPSESLWVAVTANTASSPAAQMAADIARLVLGAPRVAVTPRDDPLSKTARDTFLGRYALTQPDGTKRDVTIIERDGGIALEGLGPQPTALQWQGGDIFTMRGQAGRIYFERGDGRVTGFVLDRGARPLPARRAPR